MSFVENVYRSIITYLGKYCDFVHCNHTPIKDMTQQKERATRWLSSTCCLFAGIQHLSSSVLTILADKSRHKKCTGVTK